MKHFLSDSYRILILNYSPKKGGGFLIFNHKF